MQEGLSLLEQITKLWGEHGLNLVFGLLILIGLGASVLLYRLMLAHIKKIEKTVNPDETNLVIDTGTTNKQVDNCLLELLKRTGAARTKVIHFHNGVKSVGGVQFLFASQTNAIANRGVAIDFKMFDRLPSSIFSDIILGMNRQKLYKITQEEIVGSHLEQLFIAEGITEAFYYPIKDKGDIKGFISTHFNHHYVLNGCEIEKELLVAASKIEGILGFAA